ncbi:putative subunit p30 of RNase P/RNase MRP [Ordospora colligata]|nr:putative subunit p30 of RNase P/RNase MRP [Ordospora colligata]TBU14647.1 putative subunit p30 of RNase P/RNase MRP [Ordospora colligata]TBU18032.1 putative subunit p30 of RNase P/RNase MRP [Ordospora colligata]
MYYDVNVSEDYCTDEVKGLEESEYQGFCVCKKVKAGEFNRLLWKPKDLGVKNGWYSRIELEFAEGEAINYDQKKAMKSDVFVVRIGGAEGLDKLIKLQPDMISFDYSSPVLRLKSGLVKTAMKENIFFEIPIREGLYGVEQKVMWMRNVRKLLFVTKGKNVVVSSGAKRLSELKRVKDVILMLQTFGLKRKRAEQVLCNSKRLLEHCAMRRHCHKGMVVTSVDDGALKRDFLMKKYGWLMDG